MTPVPMVQLLAEFGLPSVSLPTTVALAAVALVGYLMGRRMRPADDPVTAQARREIKRAHAVARDLEQISRSVRDSLAQHQASLDRFKERVRQLSAQERDGAWRELCKEAEDVLRPTLRLAMQIANAYDEIRQQSGHLMSFTEVRTDPLTGVSNRRAMDEMLEAMFAMLNRYGQGFSLCIFDIDRFKQINDEQGHLAGDNVLARVAKLLADGARETDFVARYGGEEFVVLMPQTDLRGACVFSERLRRRIEEENVANLGITVSGGVASPAEGDEPHEVLGRADSALYEAKAGGRNCVYVHDGLEMRAAASEFDEVQPSA